MLAVAAVEPEAVPVFGGDVGDGVLLELAVGLEVEVPFDPGEAVELGLALELALLVA